MFGSREFGYVVKERAHETNVSRDTNQSRETKQSCGRSADHLHGMPSSSPEPPIHLVSGKIRDVTFKKTG